MQTKSFLTRALRIAAALGLTTLAAPLSLGTAALVPTPAFAQQGDARDSLILRDGKTVTGKILSETPTTVRMRVVVAGISGETDFSRSDILSIVRGNPAPDSGTPAPAAAADKNPPKTATPPEPASDKTKVYVMELSGWFGTDISQTPVRNAVRDAKRLNADYIVVVMDNDWSLRRMGRMDTLKDDDSRFEQFWRAEDIAPALNEEIEREWTKRPTVVFWVKKAMGGAAFLPFCCPNIYFHSEAKMGGIGHLSDVIKSGDQVVKEKLLGARLGHVGGMAEKGGYDKRIILAMARDEYVLSVKFEGGRPVLLERMPQSADEILLTDDGSKDENKDSDEALARGEGKNVLTLTADLAYKLGISKGTVDSLPDLLHALNLDRTSEVLKGQADHIMKSWRDGLDDAKRTLPKLWEKYQGVQVQGDYSERSAARSKQISILTEMQQIEKKYEECLNPHQVGVPNWNELETIKNQIKLGGMADKREKR